MFLTRLQRVAALTAAVVVSLAVVPPAAAGDPGIERSLDVERVDVAAVSLHDTAIQLDADETVVYTTERGSGVGVGWDTVGIEPGAVFGDAVTVRSLIADGPGEFHAEPLRLPVGEQGVTTWTFGAPGRYAVTVVVEGFLLSGEPVRAEEQYTVDVRAGSAATPETEQSRTTSKPEVVPEARVLPAAPLAAAAQPTTPGRVTLTDGHVDAVAPRLLDGRLRIQVKDGTTVGQAGGEVRWREPGDVVFHVKPAATAKLPNDARLAFLGRPGDEIFLLPQQQQAGILWTGWSTEELHANEVTGSVTWRLTTVDGPGAFGIFTTGSFGDSTVIFNSADGLPDAHSVALGTHAHANWGFAKQGTYRLTFDATAKLAGGQTVTDTEVYTFTVGSAADPGDGTPGGNGDDGNGGGNDPNLAYTGANGVVPLAAGGVLLVGLGGIALVAGRRRRKAEN